MKTAALPFVRHTLWLAIVAAFAITTGLHAQQQGPGLEWGSFLGGDEVAMGYWDQATGVACDADGNVYVVGLTDASGWVSGGWDISFNGSGDGFIVKLDSDGQHLWSSYLGGSAFDYATGVAVDAGGNVYVCGQTASSGWVSGGGDTTLNGQDGFVVKLSSAGAHLWSTYVGGDGSDAAKGIAVDGSGNAHVCGSTDTGGWLSGGWDTTVNGNTDGFVVKLSSAGAQVWSTCVGSDDDYTADAVAVDGSGNVFVVGTTSNDTWLTGGWDTTWNGSEDGYVVKLSSAGAFAWGSYLGGDADDRAQGVDTDASGNVYITGATQSESWVTGGGDTSYNGNRDAFVVKLASDGSHTWSTYLGGSESDDAFSIAVDGDEALIAGFTHSDGWLTGAWDETLDGATDGFALGLDADGNYDGGVYLGGDSTDAANAIAVDAQANIYIAGSTQSSGWLSDGWDTTFAGDSDGFVLKIGGDPAPEIAVSGNGTEITNGDTTPDAADHTDFGSTDVATGSVARVFTIANTGDAELTLEGNPQVAISGTNAADFTVTAAPSSPVATGGNTSFTIVFDPSAAGLRTATVNIPNDDPDAGAYTFAIQGIGDAQVGPGVVWSSYLGGSSSDYGNGIAVDADGNVYVTGSTRSAGWVSGGWDTTYNGGYYDAFVVKLTTAGAHVWSSYLGGSSLDLGYGIAVDAAGNVYVTGWTESSGWVSGGWDTTLNGQADAFVVKLTTDGAHVWSSYLGGGGYGPRHRHRGGRRRQRLRHRPYQLFRLGLRRLGHHIQ